MSSPALLTVDEVAAELRCSYRHALDVVKSIPFHVRVGRRVLCPRDALDRWVRQGGDRCAYTAAGTAPIGGSRGTTQKGAAKPPAPSSGTGLKRRRQGGRSVADGFWKLPKARGSSSGRR